MGYIKQGFKSKQTLTAAQLNHIEDGILDIECKGVQQTPLFANSIDECTDTTKLYVLPDGCIYAYMYGESEPPTITVETKTGGFWQLQNNEATWADVSNYYASRTNMIPVQPGDVLSYSGYSDEYVPSVYWFDSNQSLISTEYGKTEYAIPSGVSYAQFYGYNSNQSKSIITVTWVSCQAVVIDYQWKSTGHAFIPADYESRILDLEDKIGANTSRLADKRIVYDGDSICIGTYGGGGYAKIIADTVGGTYVNQAVSGARLVTKEGSTASFHSIVDNLGNLPIDGDLYCFDGGVNDVWSLAPLGTYNMSDYTGEVDKTTICGALETIFRYCLNTFVGKPICYIITHKVSNINFDNYKNYHDSAVAICNKYSIPYYDAYNKSGLNGWNTAQSNAYLTGNAAGTPDGCHPNEEGYRRYYVAQLISLFESITH